MSKEPKDSEKGDYRSVMSHLFKGNEDKATFADIYAFVYIIIVHIIGLGLIFYHNIDLTQNTADIILDVIGGVLLFLLCELCLFIPSMTLMVMAGMLSAVAAISVPLFLSLSLFQELGAESVNVLEFGFIKTLVVCVVVSPIGTMNVYVSKHIMDL